MDENVRAIGRGSEEEEEVERGSEEEEEVNCKRLLKARGGQ